MPGKILPHSLEAEKSTLGAAMLSKDALADVTEMLNPEDFYSASHQEIFRVIKAFAQDDKPVDIVTVSEELERRGSLEAAGGRSYIIGLPEESPIPGNAKSYAEVVARKATLRALIEATNKIEAACYSEEKGAEELLDNAEQHIFDIAKDRQSRDYITLEQVMKKNLDQIDKAVQSGGKLTGVPTGFARLDELTRGLQPSDLIVLAARPGMGKSAFALNVALNAAKEKDASVIVFNVEMADTQLGLRLLSVASGVDIRNIQTGKLSQSEWSDITTAMDMLSQTKIVIDDTPGNTILEMRNKCRRLKNAQGLDLIIVDYLQLLNMDGGAENRQNEIGKLSRAFKLMARELDCPVLLLSQVNRNVEARGDKRPMTSDLRDSGAIEQDADLIIFLYRDEVYTKDACVEPGICEVDLAKHRNGPTGRTKVTFVERYTRFADIAPDVAGGFGGGAPRPQQQPAGALGGQAAQGSEDFGAPSGPADFDAPDAPLDFDVPTDPHGTL